MYLHIYMELFSVIYKHNLFTVNANQHEWNNVFLSFLGLDITTPVLVHSFCYTLQEKKKKISKIKNISKNNVSLLSNGT